MNRFEQLQDGSWLDSETSLVWKEYPEKGTFSYDDALELQQKYWREGWRVPSVEELLGAIDYRLNSLATELPNAEASFFWSCSPYADYSDLAWVVHFDCGSVTYVKRNNRYAVRLVRDAIKVDASSLATGKYLLPIACLVLVASSKRRLQTNSVYI